MIGVALGRLQEQLGERPIEVRVAAEALLAPFDATLLEQVFVNLIENAVKYTPPRSPIEIAAQRVDGGVEVAVSDRVSLFGSKEEQIFGVLHRATPQTASGMGLGLTICRGISWLRTKA